MGQAQDRFQWCPFTRGVETSGPATREIVSTILFNQFSSIYNEITAFYCD
jgi:hypothetical protein